MKAAATRRVYDISPAVGPGCPVFPGDAPFTRRWTATLGAASEVNLSEVSLSPHAGAHADAPLHYDAAGASIGEVALEAYLGPCRVVHALGVPMIEPRHIATHLERTPPRVLLRTYERAPVGEWNPDFAAVAPATIDLLHAHGVRLIGIDTPSFDPQDSRALESHQAVRRHGMAVLEGLLLDGVAEGDYELIALPLKWRGLEASPVRAVLRDL